MIQKILAIFGYIKIPKKIIKLSIEQQDFLARCLMHEKDKKGREYFRQHMSAQALITAFLQKGKLCQ